MQRLPLAEGTPEGLEVWHLALDLTAPIADDDDRLLSRAEWQRAQRFRHRADAVRAMATRAALRRLRYKSEEDGTKQFLFQRRL